MRSLAMASVNFRTTMNANRYTLVRFNLVFWGCYFCYEWLSNAAFASEYCRYFLNAMVIVPISMLAAWLTVHILIPKLYERDRKRSFMLAIIFNFIFFAVLRRSFNYFYTYPLYNPEYLETMDWLYWPKLLIEGMSVFLIVAVYAMFYFANRWNQQQRHARELMQAKAETELQLLKTQVQPHFLFNTLNNIYSQAIRHNDSTADPIFRLSGLLSYMLYDSRTAWVSASKELEYIRNYVELEKIRYQDRLDVSINVYQPMDHFFISPLLLLPLVENSFKHGVYRETGNSWIRMDFSIQDEWLTVKIENSYSEHPAESNGRNGLGLENVRKQLSILYPGQHELKCLKEDGSHLVILKIKNQSHENSMPDR
ncbi:MAG: sensor histidine kinase [Chitinophagaceae bacterium]